VVDPGAAAPEASGTASAIPPPDSAAERSPSAAVDPALERERWLRGQLEHAQGRPEARPGVVVHASESRPMRFWRWLIDDLRSGRRAAAQEPDLGFLALLWQRLRAALPRPTRRRRRRRR
jgi:hypothetical protein